MMKHVLITGGSDGLGKVMAAKLIDSGYKVTILANNPDKTKAAATELGCGYVVADVSDAAAVQKAVKQANADAPIDILINNAGVWIQGDLETNTPEEIKRVFMVNSLGPINCTHAVITDFKKRRSGKIINLSSQGGLYAKAERSVYNASKWALTGFTRAMQAELKPFNISVVGIFPGAIKNTAMFAHHKEHRNMDDALDPNVVANAVVYICNLPDGINVPELGLENLSY